MKRSSQLVILAIGGSPGSAGGDVASSNPLRSFTWLTGATKLRNKLVDAAIDNVARAKVLGHIAGVKIPTRIRSVIAADIPAAQTVEFPPLRADGKDVPGVAMTVALDIDGHAPFCFAISTDVARYIQIAMAQSTTDKVERAKPKHEDRLGTKTGVKGVWKHRGRLLCRYTDPQLGVKHQCSKKIPVGDDDGTVAAAVSKRLKTMCSDMATTPQKGVPLQAPSENPGSEDEASDSHESLATAASGKAGTQAADDCAAEGSSSAAASSSAAPTQSTPKKLTPAWKKLFGVP